MVKFCGICRGAKIIRLPVQEPLSAVAFCDDEPIDATSTFEVHEYPCPECCRTIPNIAILESRITIPTGIPRSQDYIDHIKDTAANQFVYELLKKGFIEFDWGQVNDYEMTQSVVATIGVVTKQDVKKIEDRIIDRQWSVAINLVEQAKQQISNWGSYYGHDVIKKSMAYQMIDDAYRNLKNNFSKADLK